MPRQAHDSKPSTTAALRKRDETPSFYTEWWLRSRFTNQMTTHVLHLGMGHDAVSLGTLALPGVLVLAGGASLLIASLAIAAFAQRRSRSYLLIALALATLLARTVAGGLAMGELLPVGTHHVVEHSLDGVMAILLIAAVYFARTTDPTADGGST